MRTRSLAVGAAAVAVAALGAVPATAATPVRSAPSTPMCATSQLSAALGGSDAGAGNLYRYLVLTNHSGSTCHLTGYPGLSLLDSSGKQIGAPASRQPLGYQPVVLRPGGSASDTIHTINHMGKCLPTSAELRIYPPGNRASLVFTGKVTNCDNLFSVTPMLAGTSGNPSNAQTPPGTSSPTPTSRPTPTPAPTQSGGAQVPVVPSGAPDTGLAPAAHTSGGHGAATAAGGAGGLLLLGGLSAGTLRRRSRSRARG
jgi:hypothetical protein